MNKNKSKNSSTRYNLTERLNETFPLIHQVTEKHKAELAVEETGIVGYVGAGIAVVEGLTHVSSSEMVQFPDNKLGMAFNLNEESIDVVLLDTVPSLRAGDLVTRTKRVIDVPVGEELLGRVVDPLGRPLDEKGEIMTRERRPVERQAPAIMERAPVNVPLQTGIQLIDALIPIGRGQRELIVGDRQTGKTAIALDTIINQKNQGVLCVYCSIGQRSSATAKVIEDLKANGVLDNCVVVVATGENAPGLNYIAPYAATSIAEYFMDKGKDALVVYDDLTRHARSYREISLLLRRPPAREAYPGDIFYIHSRLLERATHLNREAGGGSLSALPIIETQAQNISAYIPTNLISITDGQIYLNPNLFQKGVLPAIDIGLSVSRVGGKAQLPAYRAVAGDLRLSYSQFEELESFARFGARLEEETQKTLIHGQRIRETLKQPRYQPLSVFEQLAVLISAKNGLFDALEPDQVQAAKRLVRDVVTRELPDIGVRIEKGGKLQAEEEETIINKAQAALEPLYAGREEES